MKSLKHSIALLSATIFLSGCLATAGLSGLSTQDINQKAALRYSQTMNGYQSEGKIDTSSLTSKRVHTVFQRLLPYARSANKTGVPFNWQMNVIRSDKINAWAMPGGKMVFFTGLVENLKLTDAEIAAVMGHEMTHALVEHSRQKIGGERISGLILSQVGEHYKITNNAELNNYLLGALQEFGMNRPFGRNMELEADQLGMILMARAGYNPEAAIQLQSKMAVESQNNSKLAGLLSTHPMSQQRVDELQKLLPVAKQIYQSR